MAGKIFKPLANNYHWLFTIHNPGETFLISGDWLDLDAIKLRPYLVKSGAGADYVNQDSEKRIFAYVWPAEADSAIIKNREPRIAEQRKQI